MNNTLKLTAPNIYAPGGGSGGMPGAQTADGGLIALSASATSQAIVFNVAYTTKPAVTAELISPTGATSIATKIDYSTLTTLGVTVRFSAIPASGWFLSWQSVGS